MPKRPQHFQSHFALADHPTIVPPSIIHLLLSSCNAGFRLFRLLPLMHAPVLQSTIFRHGHLPPCRRPSRR